MSDTKKTAGTQKDAPGKQKMTLADCKRLGLDPTVYGLKKKEA